ncbi:MAG TPA: pyridoxal-dependent decarboxylase, exosortase A system-associated [Sphingomicrobium sp.]|nr:pyridoxal-dependent decarboxylase, exosortase A system-associated [Sphingomicrobium sp.]
MKPSGPIPAQFMAGEDGQLMLGGESVSDLVAEVGGTPVFVYDNNVVGTQISRFRAAMPSGIFLNYAVSANPYEPLLEFIGRYVDGFRVVSAGEMARLKAANLAGIGMTFAGPGKTDSELEAAIKNGATVSLESAGEAERAIRAGERLGIQPRVAVRVDPPFAIGIDGSIAAVAPNPFGFDAAEVPEMIRGLIEADVDWRGLHIFTGSQWLDTDTLIEVHQRTITLACEIADSAGVSLPELSLGGGFGTTSVEGEWPIDLDAVANALNTGICGASDSLATTAIAIELGRWLVADCGVYVCRVVERKRSAGRTFLVTDGGGHHLIGATGPFGEPPRRNNPIAVANRFDAPVEEAVTVTGCLCTPFDVLGDDVGLPVAEPGDLIAIFNTGAYGLTASPQGWESRPMAREIMV